MPKSRLWVLVFSVLPLSAEVDAASVVVTRTNTGDIVIPAFDTSLGTLDQATLNIRLLPTTTSLRGSHTHPARRLLSSNAVSQPVSGFGGGNIGFTTDSSLLSSGHSFTTPAYMGGGLTIGSFAGTSSSSAPDAEHDHRFVISYDGFQQVAGTSTYQVWANLSFTPYQTSHTHSIPAVVKIVHVLGADLNSFLSGSDITIPAGPVPTDSAGIHLHGIAAFSRPLTTISGTQVANFDAASTQIAGAHTHTFDPRFTTIATFQYTPIPEPPQAMVLAVLTAFAFMAKRLRNHRHESRHMPD